LGEILFGEVGKLLGRQGPCLPEVVEGEVFVDNCGKRAGSIQTRWQMDAVLEASRRNGFAGS